MTEASSCTGELVELVDGAYKPIPLSPTADEPCWDCGVDPGGYHHPGCDMEACPRCGGQLISCDCWPEDAEPE